MKPAGIILAAGESSRMGRDKALLPYGGSTFLQHLIAVLRPRVEPLIVVLGHHAGEIAAALGPPGEFTVVVNENYSQGMLSSLQTGLRAVPEASAFLFTLVDHPAVQEETVDHLAEQFQQGGRELAIPRYGNRRGHPVLIGRRVAGEILALPPDRSAKDVIRGHRGETLFVDVEDPGVLRDVDLPGDYEALLRDRGDPSNF